MLVFLAAALLITAFFVHRFGWLDRMLLRPPVPVAGWGEVELLKARVTVRMPPRTGGFMEDEMSRTLSGEAVQRGLRCYYAEGGPLVRLEGRDAAVDMRNRWIDKMKANRAVLEFSADDVVEIPHLSDNGPAYGFRGRAKQMLLTRPFSLPTATYSETLLVATPDGNGVEMVMFSPSPNDTPAAESFFATAEVISEEAAERRRMEGVRDTMRNVPEIYWPDELREWVRENPEG